MCLRVYGSVKEVNGAANALLWKSSETQNFAHLTILKHQNTKTSLNKLSKNHSIIAIFEIFGSVRKKIQSTVFNDHPVHQILMPDQMFSEHLKDNEGALPLSRV